ncbi:hypothetical protein PFZ49_10355 [Microbacterium lacticum]|uniref:Uncharacterized protein n=1 Tax=Microbacterium lacticum TaxID=33885 RepID=A0A4Y3UMS3_9MICO|nr:hypothetical protein [Microbacterium lacticum]TQM98912.1 hypothetical protein FHX68_1632 [Microbacterium lacticum]GEB94700.1 hypothetical protein MLA01_09190 [Microbacterium lacticum]GGN12472.1 hypothetical protein GCM10009724_02280 [Microbacterium lacticum]
MSDADAGADATPSEFDQAVTWLQRLTGDPLADAVPGRIRIDEVTDASPRPRYQECRIEATAEAPGVPPTPVTLHVVIDRRFWPRVGQVLPARVPPGSPAALEVSWDALRRA